MQGLSRFIAIVAFAVAVPAAAQNLIVINSGAQVTLAAGSLPGQPAHPVIPAGTPGVPTIVNITTNMASNANGDWTALESQRAVLSSTLHYAWHGPAGYGTGTLTIDPSAVAPLATIAVAGTIAAADRIQLNSQFVIAPGLHGIVGNADGNGGGTDDAPAIRAYLASIVSTVAGESLSVSVGGLVCSAGIVTATFDSNSVSGGRFGGVVNITPGEAGFPAGRKIITGLGFLTDGANPHTVQYAEPSCNGTSTITENVGAMRKGVKVQWAAGAYRISSTIDIPGTFVFDGGGMNPSGSGTIVYADAGVTAFTISNLAYGTIMRDMSIIATGKSPLPNNSPRSGTSKYVLDNDPGQAVTLGGPGSYSVMLNSVGDASGYHNGDVVRIEGASLNPVVIYTLSLQTTIGSAVMTYSNINQPVYAGLYAGQYLKLPGAWTRERVVQVDTTAHTVTMASNASATLHFGSVGDGNQVVYYPDAIAQIQTGGGTVNLTVEDNAILPSTQSYLHHFHSAIYGSTQIHLEHVFIQGFKGAGVVNNGSGNSQPSGFAEESTLVAVQVDFCGFGFYGKGVDGNTSSYVNFAADFEDLLSIYSEQFGGTTWTNPVAQVAPLGHVIGSTSNQGQVYISPYNEGSTNAIGPGMICIGCGIYENQAIAINRNGLIINGTNASAVPSFQTDSFAPWIAGSSVMGARLGEWGQIWNRVYAGRVQDITSQHGAITINPLGGETVRLTGDGSAISSLTLTVGKDGQMLSLIVAQDPGNTTTWPSTIGNVKLIGGSWMKTLGANKEDNLLFRCDAVVWRQVTPTASNLQ